MRVAREEKERKNNMFERGVPKPQPLTEAQIAEKEAIKEITYNQRGVPKSQLATKGALTTGNEASG